MNFALSFEFNEIFLRLKSFIFGFFSRFFGFTLIKGFFQVFNLLAVGSRIIDFEINDEIGSALQVKSKTLNKDFLTLFFLLKEMKLIWERVFGNRKPFPKETEEEKGRKKPNRP
jgi:hypothetical protein